MPNYDYAPIEMDVIERGGNRFGWGNLTFDDLISRFDISRFPDFDNAAEPYLAYIIMSRPDINLSGSNLDVLHSHTMTSAFTNDTYGNKLLLSLGSTDANSTRQRHNMFLPVITTRAMSYQTTDVAIKTIEKGNTFYGHLIKYGKHSEDHKVGGSFTIDFRNDRYLSVLKLVYIWMCYIYLVSKTGDVEPFEEYQQNGVLDYAASLYYLVVKRDGRELVFWEKLTGVFPKSAPFSIFSYSDDFILNDRISVEWDFGIRSDPCDPEVLIDLNTLAGLTTGRMKKISKFDIQNRSITSRGFEDDPFVKYFGVNGLAFVNSLEAPFAFGNSFAEVPYVHTKIMDDGTIRYYLDWIKEV